MQSCVLKATEAISYVANTLFGLKSNRDETATNIPLFTEIENFLMIPFKTWRSLQNLGYDQAKAIW